MIYLLAWLLLAFITLAIILPMFILAKRADEQSERFTREHL